MIAAQPRTFERINVNREDILYLSDTNSERDLGRIVAAKQAVENFDADEWFSDAEKAEAEGDYYMAALMFVDNAHIERTGKFHRRAIRCLWRAARLLKDYYEQTVLMIATRSFLTRRDVRMVFQFAEMEVPDWLERIWLNNRRSDSWKHRWDVGADDGTLSDWHRCVVCEEWLSNEECISSSIGYVHSDYACLAKAAGITAPNPLKT